MVNSIQDNPKLLLDTGNLLFRRYQKKYQEGYPVKHQAILEIMKIMDYKAVNLGPNDIVSNLDFIQTHCDADHFPLISANLNVSNVSLNSNCIQQHTIIEINDMHVGITGIMPAPTDAQKMHPGLETIDPVTALAPVLSELTPKTDLIILLSQFNKKETSGIAAKLPGIDLALCTSSYSDRKKTQNETNAPYVMSILPKGAEIGVIKIVKTDSGIKITEAKRISINHHTPSDETISTLASDAMDKWDAALKRQKEKEQNKAAMKNLDQSLEDFVKTYSPN